MRSHSLRQNSTPQYRLRRKSPEVKPDNLAALNIYYNTIPYTATQGLIQISWADVNWSNDNRLTKQY